jgi:adenosylhomocysteine nucleosidase
MPSGDEQHLECDLLLFVATSSERKALKEAAQKLGLRYEGKHVEGAGSFKTMGSIGPNRVNVFETAMGPFGYRGSAGTAMRAMGVTGATGIIQLGMAFGAYPARQGIGDVLVSSSIVAYDYHTVRELPGGTLPFEADYADPSNPTPRFEAKESLLNLFAHAAENPGGAFRVHVGTLLSGGARIQSASYRDYLLRSVPHGNEPFIGGEMEGVGLPPANVDPAWILVKGISDFADGADPDSFADRRALACDNAVRFVLHALASLSEKLK